MAAPNKRKSLQAPAGKKLALKTVTVCGYKRVQETSALAGKTTYFEIRFKTGSGEYRVFKRYSEFNELREMLKKNKNVTEKPSPLPAKRWLNMNKEFLNERRVLLNNWLKKLAADEQSSKSQELLQWLMAEKEDLPKEDENEQKEHKFPDDQEITDIKIPGVTKMPDHVLYNIEFSNSRKRSSFECWKSLKRYAQIASLDSALRKGLKDKKEVVKSLPPLPPASNKIFVDHTSDQFIEERRALLENYLSKLLFIPEVASHKEFLDFAGLVQSTAVSPAAE